MLLGLRRLMLLLAAMSQLAMWYLQMQKQECLRRQMKEWSLEPMGHLLRVLPPGILSRHGPVTVEVAAALTAMDCGPELTRVWSELDSYVGTVVENDRERVVERANDLADRLLRAQVGLTETLYKREWNEDTAPMMFSCQERGVEERLPVVSITLTSTRMVQRSNELAENANALSWHPD
eukprot:s3565_g13.t1